MEDLVDYVLLQELPCIPLIFSVLKHGSWMHVSVHGSRMHVSVQIVRHTLAI